jgi:hypothetical protein
MALGGAGAAGRARPPGPGSARRVRERRASLRGQRSRARVDRRHGSTRLGAPSPVQAGRDPRLRAGLGRRVSSTGSGSDPARWPGRLERTPGAAWLRGRRKRGRGCRRPPDRAPGAWPSRLRLVAAGRRRHGSGASPGYRLGNGWGARPAQSSAVRWRSRSARAPGQEEPHWCRSQGLERPQAPTQARPAIRGSAPAPAASATSAGPIMASRVRRRAAAPPGYVGCSGIDTRCRLRRFRADGLHRPGPGTARPRLSRPRSSRRRSGWDVPSSTATRGAATVAAGGVDVEASGAWTTASISDARRAPRSRARAENGKGPQGNGPDRGPPPRRLSTLCNIRPRLDVAPRGAPMVPPVLAQASRPAKPPLAGPDPEGGPFPCPIAPAPKVRPCCC